MNFLFRHKISALVVTVLAMLLFAPNKTVAQEDSLWANYDAKKGKNDSTELQALYDLSVPLRYTNPDTALPLINTGIELAKHIHNVHFLPMFHEIKADVYWHLSEFDSSIVEYKVSRKLYEESGRILFAGHNYADIGYVYMDKHDYKTALTYYHKALDIAEEQESEGLKIIALTYLGQIYHKRSEYEKALEVYEKALDYFLENPEGNERNISIMYSNVANLYMKLDKEESAVVYFNRGLKLAEKQNDEKNISNISLSLAELYYKNEDYKKAEIYYLDAIKGYEVLDSYFHMMEAYLSIADLYYITNQFDKAYEFYKKTYDISLKTDDVSKQSLADKGLAMYYEHKQDYSKALSYYKSYMELNDSIQKLESENQMNELLTKYETEQKELEIANLEKEKAMDEAEIAKERSKLVEQQAKSEQEKIFRYALLIGIILLLAIVGYVWYAYNQKSKANLIISEQKALVEEQKKQVEIQKEEIEDAHKEIKDSINYAKRIQTAILPPIQTVNEYLRDSFILYLPKDIVAGDFYWLEHKGENVFFAAADCTGHGVPGAMVSVICNNALNRSVREFGLEKPGEILDKTRDFVQMEFSKSEEAVSDGMDIALCGITQSEEVNKITFAGANNPMWIVRNGEVIVVPADKQPVGKFENSKPYTTHEIDLKKGDSIYIFSDGYQDQFGGEKGKKFKSSNFKKLLIEINSLSMTEQRDILEKRYIEWRGDIEQIDDVCVIGFRI